MSTTHPADAILEVKSLAPTLHSQGDEVKALFLMYELALDTGSFNRPDIALVFLDELVEEMQVLAQVAPDNAFDWGLALEIAERAVALQRLLLRWMGDAA